MSPESPGRLLKCRRQTLNLFLILKVYVEPHDFVFQTGKGDAAVLGPQFENG